MAAVNRDGPAERKRPLAKQEPMKVLWDRLASAVPEDVVTRAAVSYDPAARVYVVSLLGAEFRVDPAAKTVESPSGAAGFGPTLICLMYLLSAQDKPLAGELVNPRALPAGDFFFRGPHDLPTDKLEQTFGNSTNLFQRAAAGLDGRPVPIGDAGHEFLPLPRVPVAVALWVADDEFPARVQFLFDKTAGDHLPLDVLWLMCGMLAGRLVELGTQDD